LAERFERRAEKGATDPVGNGLRGVALLGAASLASVSHTNQASAGPFEAPPCPFKVASDLVRFVASSVWPTTQPDDESESRVAPVTRKSLERDMCFGLPGAPSPPRKSLHPGRDSGRQAHRTALSVVRVDWDAPTE
jgi:hypothetical protein